MHRVLYSSSRIWLILIALSLMLAVLPGAVGAEATQPTPSIWGDILNSTNPMLPAGAPVLTLLDPVIDGQNVTINGNLNPVSPGVTITSVSLDWGDGNITEYPDLPATHQYSKTGLFTVNVTGKQSDGQSIAKALSLELNADDRGPITPALSTPPPEENLTIFIIILVTAVVVVALGGIVMRIMWRRGEQATVSDLLRAVAIQEDLYHQAMERRDMTTAAASAYICAHLLRTLAGKFSGRRHSKYLETANTWEREARCAAKAGGITQITGSSSKNLPSAEDLERICSGTDVTPAVLGSVLQIAIDMAREGREGQAVGTSFVVGDTDAVLDHSRQFVLNPFQGLSPAERQITDSRIRGNIKEFAQLDGAFIVRGDGTVEAAGLYITVETSRVDIPEGLGSRHSSIAGITQSTNALGVVVSQSGGLITLFKGGKILYTIWP